MVVINPPCETFGFEEKDYDAIEWEGRMSLSCWKIYNKQWKTILIRNVDVFFLSFSSLMFVCIFLQVGNASCQCLN
jgi:hypothetical protein